MANGKLAQVRAFFGLSADDEYADETYYGAEQPYAAPTVDARRYSGDAYDSYYDSHAPRHASPRDAYGYEQPVVERREQPREIRVVTIEKYEDATMLGRPFRDEYPVVFDMGDLSREDARHIVDFAAGLCFALRGRMEKLNGRVFALIPQGSPVRTDDLKDAARL